MNRQTRSDLKKIRDGLKRLRATSTEHRWGSNYAWTDRVLANEGLEAANRIEAILKQSTAVSQPSLFEK